MVDRDYMARALALAARGRGRTSPNPMVGAVVVTPDGVVAGSGYHEQAGAPHAEIRALAAAGDRSRGATLYCTLEPCCHTGRTGPCVGPIVAAGIARVVAAMEDPNPLVCGGGFRYLRERGVVVTTGVCADAATGLNRPFLTLVRSGRPSVTLKAALSLDGRMADQPGRRTSLTGLAANRLVHRDRAEVDAVAVGSGTVLADDPLLTPRGAFRARPLTRVIFDTRLRTPPSARLLSTLAAGPVIIMSTRAAIGMAQERADALIAAGAIIAPLDSPELTDALERLAARGIASLLVEGGATLHAAFCRARLVDRVQVIAFTWEHTNLKASRQHDLVN
ncbi:MAG: bifunctional diaminohydroxyphosphoribosylaminopyrimidine deaminase/5-amino-6-(5-phosphoribosylamino)uracil reductase RibD, partial [Acidobacteria bacterium]|nr:bifunctional diaminohydroxyphosphoribosylaminopyrimidine deaminase/5-amino-6-(5-phosphoribosylamino)uracil reductase RibD [Acidobacteriota bacterium]